MLSVTDIAQLEFMTYGIFTFGIITGLVVGGLFKNIISIITSDITHPRRIRISDGFLYRFGNKYYPLEQRNSLIKQAIERYKARREQK
jgi:hypothetical protein